MRRVDAGHPGSVLTHARGWFRKSRVKRTLEDPNRDPLTVLAGREPEVRLSRSMHALWFGLPGWTAMPLALAHWAGSAALHLASRGYAQATPRCDNQKGKRQ